MGQINILGAGLSGLSAAINLAKSGFDANVFDIRKDSGARFEGDLQGLENWSSSNNIIEDLDHMNIKTNFHCAPFTKILATDGNKIVEKNSAKPFFYLVKRGTMEDSIDQGLKRQAIDSGVKINYGRGFDGKVDIDASGPKMDNLLGIDRGIVFDTDADDIAVIIVNKKAAANGYSYLLVTEGYGCIATAIAGNYGLVNKCLENTIDVVKRMFNPNIRNQKGVGGFANFIYPPRLEENDTLFVGESAGFQEAMLGFGMRYAITSGYFASRSIVEGISYSKLIKERFDNQFKASMVNRFMWELMSGRSVSLSRHAEKVDPIRVLGKLYNFQYPHQKLLYHLARTWFNHRPGRSKR